MTDPRWARALTYSRDGLLTADEARSTGITHTMIRRAAKAGRLTQPHRGILDLRTADPDLPRQCTAALLATRGGILGGHTAARLWHLDGASVTVPEIILDPADTRVQRRGVRLSWRILDAGEHVRIGDLPVTTVSRTLLDLARREPARAALPLIDSALRQRLLDPQDLPPLAARARSGRLAFRLADGRAESVFESVVRLDLSLAGLAPESLQHEVFTSSGRWVARVDMAWPSRRLVVELDGFATHGTPEALRSDLLRQNALVAAGWTVLRFAWADRGRVVPAVRSALTAAA